MPIARPFVLACAALGIAGAAAQTSPLEDLVVTASRAPVARDRVGSSLTVIDRAALEVKQQIFVADALRDVPGVAVSRGGGLGAVTQVRIRGAEGNHALVLIDGVEANNPVSNSEFDFANLLVSDIERIEILRGAQSALYGSDAVGGVINIITRERPAGFEAALQAEAGSFGTRRHALDLGGGNDRLTGGLALQRFSSDGHNVSRFGDEADGFENDAVSLHGRALIGERIELAGTLRHIESEQDFDSQDFAFPPTPTQGLLIDDDVSSRLDQSFGRLRASIDGARVSQQLGIAETRTHNRFFDAALAAGENRGEKSKLDYQLAVALGRTETADLGGTLVVALEREDSDYTNRGASPESPENQIQSDRQTGVAVEYRLGLERADFSASARHDDNRLFDDADSFRLTGQYRLGERTRLHTSLGTGIANPGFFELFGFFPGSFVGNPELKPERSTNFDIGIERRFAGDRVRVDWTYFRADLSDEIVTTFDSASFLSSVANLDGDSERRGVELSLDANITERWRLSAAYTYTDADQPDGRAELRRARHIAALDSAFEMAGGRARINVGIDYNGRQYDTELVAATPETIVSLPSFTLVRVGGDYRPRPRLRVFARLENALDEDYEEWFSYRGRGRAFVAGLELELTR